MRKTHFGAVSGFVLGVFLTVEFALAVGWYVSERGDTLYKVMTEWSGFTGAIIAAILASLTVREGIRYQRQRELAGARAVLPLALTRLSEIGRKGMELACNFQGIQQEQSVEVQKMPRC